MDETCTPSDSGGSSHASAASPSNSTVSPLPQVPERDFATTAAYLEYMSLALGDAITSQTFEDSWITQFMSPTFKFNTHSDQHGEMTGIKEYFDEPRRHIKNFPHIWMRFFDPEATVDEKAGRAMVYAIFEITGAPPGVKKQNVAVLEWKLGQDRWLLTRLTGLRGFGDIDLPT